MRPILAALNHRLTGESFDARVGQLACILGGIASFPMAVLDHYGKNQSTPNHDARIDPVTALVTYRDAQRNLSFLTEGTNIGIQEQLDVSTHCRTALRASQVLELEVPHPITLGTAIVRNNLDFAIPHVFLGR